MYGYGTEQDAPDAVQYPTLSCVRRGTVIRLSRAEPQAALEAEPPAALGQQPSASTSTAAAEAAAAAAAAAEATAAASAAAAATSAAMAAAAVAAGGMPAGQLDTTMHDYDCEPEAAVNILTPAAAAALGPVAAAGTTIGGNHAVASDCMHMHAGRVDVAGSGVWKFQHTQAWPSDASAAAAGHEGTTKAKQAGVGSGATPAIATAMAATAGRMAGGCTAGYPGVLQHNQHMPQQQQQQACMQQQGLRNGMQAFWQQHGAAAATAAAAMERRRHPGMSTATSSSSTALHH